MARYYTGPEWKLGRTLYEKLQKNWPPGVAKLDFDTLPVEERNAFIKTAVEMDEATKPEAVTDAVTGQRLYELIQHQLDSQGMHDPVSFAGGWVHLSVWLKRAFEGVASSISVRVQEPQDKPEVLDVSWIVEDDDKWRFFDSETDLLEWWILNRENVGRIFRINVSNQKSQCVVMDKSGGRLTLRLDDMPGAAYVAPSSPNVGQASLGNPPVSFRPAESILGQFKDDVE